MILEHKFPQVDRVIIVDPYNPTNSLVLIVTGLLLCLACLVLIYISEVKGMNEKQVSKYFVWASNVAIFIMLLSLTAIYYPAIDHWWFVNTRVPFWYGLAQALTQYGRLHIPSVIFTFLAFFSAIISPVFTHLLVKGFEMVVTQIRAGSAEPVTKS